MRTVKYKTRQGEEAHEILTPEEAEARGLSYLKDYKNATAKGNLILTDDGFVLEILKFGKSSRTGQRWIRTCIGTFCIDRKIPYVDTEPRESRFTFSGKARKMSHLKFAIEWDAFAEYLVRGYKPSIAYRMVYPNAKSNRYVNEKALLLMQKKEVRKIVDRKLEDVFAELDIDDKFIISEYKRLVEGADSDSVSLQALNALAEIRGIKGQKVSSTTTKVFMGIPQNELIAADNGVAVIPDSVQLPELPEGVKDDDDGNEITLEDKIY